jgi:nitroreductase
MDTLDAIRTRRSIRSFLDKPVPDAIIHTLLEAAMQAPSAGNEQAWQFVVIEDRQIALQIPRFHPHAEMLKTAPLAIVICGDLSRQKYPGRWPQDCSAATQNLLLAAHALCLGAVWVGIHPDPDRVDGMRALLSLPEDIIPLSLIPLGYPATSALPVSRFDPAKVHRNRW